MAAPGRVIEWATAVVVLEWEINPISIDFKQHPCPGELVPRGRSVLQNHPEGYKSLKSA